MNVVLMLAAILAGLVLYAVLVLAVGRVLGWLRDDIDAESWDQASHVRLHQLFDEQAGDR